MTRPLRVGLSTCPNDTFLFHALLERELDTHGLELEFELHDVQELNERLARGEFDAAKGSFHCGLLLADELAVLDCGSALGFGVGPLLLAGRGPAHTPPRVLCPGRWTTASLLWALFHGAEAAPEQVVFSEIMPALEAGEADLGVCIHEGRFTWRERGLERVEDLGERWEAATGAALPLGGILVRRSLGEDTARRLNACLVDSLDWARAHRAATRPTMARHAQELAPEVIEAHVDLYVNEHTRSLGEVGRAALAALDREARRAGLVAQDAPRLEVVG